jgi:uracil-DNA glycosylase
MSSTSEDRRFPNNLPRGWKKIFKTEGDSDYFKALGKFVALEDKKHPGEVYPPLPLRLRALRELDLDDVRVLILGQDPYHGPGQAMGLSFAVPNSLQPKPPSLVNIYKEIESDLGTKINRSQSELSGWAKQGVLLLNTVLTVRKGEAFSHRNQGWEQFTDRVIAELGRREKPLVFLLWGAAAQKKKALIENPKHLILESPHPSPLSAHRGFFGSKPFSRINAWLKKQGEEPIDWTKVG